MRSNPKGSSTPSQDGGEEAARLKVHNPGNPPPVDPGEAWRVRAQDLATWADKHLVNRRDAFGRYIDVENRRDPKLTALTDKTGLTLDVLAAHFRGERTGDIIGLHSTGRDEATGEGEVVACWSRWLAIDIDRHDENTDPAKTLNTALAFYQKTSKLGIRCLLFDSNGNGGYHLEIVFHAPVATEKVHAFGLWIVREWKALGLDKAPEVFPKQAAIQAGGFGNWLRLPGHHHTREHWSKVWDGSAWLDGDQAVDYILATSGSSGSLIPPEAFKAEKRPRKPPASRVGFDGTDDVSLASQALDYLSPEDYEDWINVGLSLTKLGGDGLKLWDRWSSTSQKYQEGDCERKWKSFKAPSGNVHVSLGTLFHLAKARGFELPKRANSLRSKTGSKPSTLGDSRGNADRATEAETEGASGGDDIPSDGDGPKPPEKPEIEITTDRHEVVEEAIRALAASKTLYRRGADLVEVPDEESEAEDTLRLTSKTGLHGVAGSPQTLVLSDSNVSCHLTRCATFYQMKTPAKGVAVPVDVHPPEWLIKAVATRGYWPGIRELVAVVECPYPRADGSICETPGYDRSTGTLYRPSMKFPPVPERPTQEDAAAAWERIKAPIRQFPFATEDDRATFLGGLLTPVARPVIKGPVPGFAVNGNKAGCGKGLLIDFIGCAAFGRPVPTSIYPSDKDEAGKVKVAIAVSNKPVIHFDNIDEGGVYGNSGTDSALTSLTVDDRILGASKMTGEIPMRVSWFLSGNNLSPAKDAYRRWLPINLLTNEERPEERKDLEIPDLRAFALRHRGEIVRDVLTILRAHALAGFPSGGWGPLGSFESWDRIVRGAVWFASGRDCVATRRKAADDAPDRKAKLALIEGWKELSAGASTGHTAADAVEKASSGDLYPTLKNALLNFGRDGKPADSRRLGALLRGMKGNNLGDWRFVEAGETHRTTLWKVEQVQHNPPILPDNPGSEGPERGTYGLGGHTSNHPSDANHDDNYVNTYGYKGNAQRNGPETSPPSPYVPLGRETFDL